MSDSESLRGFVEIVNEDEIRGWVCDLARLDDALCVAVCFAGGFKVEVVAEIYREDLKAAGFGNGLHEFQVRREAFPTVTDINFVEVFVGDWQVPFEQSLWRPFPPSTSIEFSVSATTPPQLDDTSAFLADDGETAKQKNNSINDVTALIRASGFLDVNFAADQLSSSDLRSFFRNDPVGYLMSPDAEPVDTHPLFDASWYIARYGVQETGPSHPLVHYVTTGMRAGLMPNCGFDPAWYLLSVPVAERQEALVNPLLHYQNVGAKRLHSPHPLFLPSWYYDKHADVRKAGADALAHYLRAGDRENRQIHPLIDTKYVRDQLGSDKHLIDLVASEGLKQVDILHPLLAFQKKRASSHKPSIPAKLSRLESWRRINSPNAKRSLRIRDIAHRAKDSLMFSIVTPVYNTPLSILRTTVDSVLKQSYTNFEFILVDDASPAMSVRRELQEISKTDSRIRVTMRKTNGHISRATNHGVRLASGSYVVFLDHDDLLFEHSLSILAIYINAYRHPDLLYSDDCRVDEQGVITSIRLKPGWSPDLLFSYSYLSHLRAVRTDLYKSVGGSRVGYEGSQDQDMFLRLTAAGATVEHIPHVLYARRAIEGSTAAGGDNKPYGFKAAERALEDAYAQLGKSVSVRRADWAISRGLGIYRPVMPHSGPSVTILIPTKNNRNVLIRLLRSLSLTLYSNYKVLIIDNGSDDPDLLSYYASTSYNHIVVQSDPEGFNYAKINNIAAKQVDSDLILFLNDDTEVITPDWLSQMVGWLSIPKIGAVGARLLFSDRRVQHGGVSPESRVGFTLFRGMSVTDDGYMSLARVTRDCAAVTAACMLVPRELFLSLGGFDEERFGVAFNDVDFCLRLQQRGRRVVYCGEAELLHHEGTSREKTDKVSEIAAFKKLYGKYKDPYFHPALDRNSNRMEIAPTAVPVPFTNRSLKVLFCSHNLNDEGAPNSLFELVAGLRAAGDMEVVVASPRVGPLAQTYAKIGVDVRISDVLGAAAKAKDLEQYDAAVARACSEMLIEQFDVVFANTAEMHIAVNAAYAMQVPSVWCIREGEDWDRYFSNVPDFVEQRALEAFQKPYRVVFVSQASLSRWAALNTRFTFECIPNGLDVERFSARANVDERDDLRRRLGFTDRDLVILAVGGMIPRKGQHDLIFALPLLPLEILGRVQILFVGARSNEYFKRISWIIDSMPSQLRNRVTVIPESTNITHYFRIADLFFCGSRVESYPRIILEAELASLPIITSPVSGIPEQVRFGFNAKAYEPGNAIDLAAKLASVLKDADQLRIMGENSRKVFDSLDDFDMMVSRYGMILNSASWSTPPKVD